MQRIDSGFPSFLSLVIDADGHSHIAASDYFSVYYVTDATGAWTRTDLSRAPKGGADIEPSVALAGDGTIAVAFTRLSVFGFFCDDCPATDKVDGAYVVTSEAGRWSKPSRISVGSEGPSVGFIDGALNVVYAQKDGAYWGQRVGSGWDTQKIGGADAAGASLQVAPDGTAHVTLGSPDGLVLLHQEGALERETVPGTDENGGQLLIDPQGRLTVLTSYLDTTGARTLHRFRIAHTGDDWLAPQEFTFDEPMEAVAIDASGNLHVTYQTMTEDERSWTYYWEDAWYASVSSDGVTKFHLFRGVFSDLGPYSAATIALDSAGRPHVVFSSGGIYDGEGQQVPGGTFVVVGDPP